MTRRPGSTARRYGQVFDEIAAETGVDPLERTASRARRSAALLLGYGQPRSGGWSGVRWCFPKARFPRQAEMWIPGGIPL